MDRTRVLAIRLAIQIFTVIEKIRGSIPSVSSRSDRAIEPHAAFERAVRRALDLNDDDTAREFWSARANRDWIHADGDVVGYSFRAAGDLIAEVRGQGC